jgi:hypothetical protein
MGHTLPKLDILIPLEIPLSLSCQQDSAKGKEKRKKRKNREQEGIRVMTKITVLFPSHMAQVQTCYCTLFPFFHPSM